MSDAPTHSPSPWFVVNGGVYSQPLHRITEVNGKPYHEGLVALVYGHHDASGNYSLESNCNLIEAAPDAIAAAEIAIVELEAVEREIGVPSKALPLLRAFVAKAQP